MCNYFLRKFYSTTSPVVSKVMLKNEYLRKDIIKIFFHFFKFMLNIHKTIHILRLRNEQFK